MVTLKILFSGIGPSTHNHRVVTIPVRIVLSPTCHFILFSIVTSKLTWDESVKRDLKDWNISKEVALDRSVWRLAINVHEP